MFTPSKAPGSIPSLSRGFALISVQGEKKSVGILCALDTADLILFITSDVLSIN